MFWTWRIRHGTPGRPKVPREIRDLIRILSRNNPRWGAPRIHGELLKLGIEITEPTVAKYMVRALRQQLTVLRRSTPKRLKLTWADRMFWVLIRRVWGDWKSALMIVQEIRSERDRVQTDAGKQRATYGAVAELLGVPARSLLSGRPKSPDDAWIVASDTGVPTGYDEFLNQICAACLTKSPVAGPESQYPATPPEVHPCVVSGYKSSL